MPRFRRVPFFDYPRLFLDRREELLEVISGVLGRGAFILQDDVVQFERRFAERVGVRHAIGVANCTDGLLIALMAAGVGPGDEVLVPSHTFVATAAAVHWAGATPVLVDCGPDHLMDVEDAARKVTPRTRCVMPVQLNGRVCAMDRVLELATRQGLLVVEDAAQGFGASFQGRQAGSFGRAAAFSFYPAKLLGTFGDGGMVVTDDDDVAAAARLLRDHGRVDRGEVVRWGMNSRLDNLHAAILDFSLSSFDDVVARRRAIAAEYTERLSGLPGLVLPPPPGSDPDRFDVFQNYEIESDRRDELRAHLAEAGVGSLVQWTGWPVHHNRALGFDLELPATDRLFERCLLLPMNPLLSDDDVHHVAASVRELHARRA